MRRRALRAVRLLVLPTGALLVVAAFAPGRFGLAVRIYALLLSGGVLVLALGALRRAYPPETPFRNPVRTPTRRPRHVPASLVRIEHETALGVARAFDLHYRLVPRLRGLASGLLESRRRISLAAQPAEARAVLGDETWQLVRPDRSAPEDRRAPGLAPEALARVVESLERV